MQNYHIDYLVGSYEGTVRPEGEPCERLEGWRSRRDDARLLRYGSSRHEACLTTNGACTVQIFVFFELSSGVKQNFTEIAVCYLFWFFTLFLQQCSLYAK